MHCWPEDLRAANQNQNEFLAVLGHELRNPLAPLSAGLTLLERARAQPELLDRLQPMMEPQFGHLFGIRLALARRLLAMHGGTIGRRLGQGSEFIVTVPLNRTA